MANSRIQSLDEIRGLAVLGMFAVNILAFGMPVHAFVDPGLTSDFRAVDRALFLVSSLALEGTFRAIFCVLFGMGILLQYERLRTSHGETLARLRHRRRMTWLALFGLADAYLLLWFGDILFAYGLIGMCLLRLHHLKALKLLSIAVLLLGLLALQNLFFGYALAAPENQEIDLSGAVVVGGYFSAWPERAMLALYMQLSLLWRGAWEALALMLIGMAAYKAGVHRMTLSPWRWALIAVPALVVGLSINYWEVERAHDLGRPALTQLLWSYDLGRMAMAIGVSGLCVSLSRSSHPRSRALRCVSHLQARILARLRAGLAATGRLALTNYLMQSLICLVLFVGFGFFGEFRYHQLMYVVAAVWPLQVFTSVLWLRRFPQGPIERVLRWLIMWREKAA